MSIKILKKFLVFAKEFDIDPNAENLRKFRRIYKND